MFELWLLIYIAFPPLAYMGVAGILGPDAKRAADRFFFTIGFVLAIVGFILMAQLVWDVLVAFIQSLSG